MTAEQIAAEVARAILLLCAGCHITIACLAVRRILQETTDA